MRCGRYIRTRIEPPIMGDEGWEAWLESESDPEIGAVSNQLVDTYLAYAFYLLIGAYYFATSYVAVTYASREYGPVGERVTLGVYGLMGLALGFIVIRRVPTNTTTKKERERILAKQRVPVAPPTPVNRDVAPLGADTSNDGAPPTVVQLDEGAPNPPSQDRPVQS
jgi:hypothetical protein